MCPSCHHSTDFSTFPTGFERFAASDELSACTASGEGGRLPADEDVGWFASWTLEHLGRQFK